MVILKPLFVQSSSVGDEITVLWHRSYGSMVQKLRFVGHEVTAIYGIGYGNLVDSLRLSCSDHPWPLLLRRGNKMFIYNVRAMGEGLNSVKKMKIFA